MGCFLIRDLNCLQKLGIERGRGKREEKGEKVQKAIECRIVIFGLEDKGEKEINKNVISDLFTKMDY